MAWVGGRGRIGTLSPQVSALTFVKQADRRYTLLGSRRLDGMASIKEHHTGMRVGVGDEFNPQNPRKKLGGGDIRAIEAHWPGS